MFELFSTRSLTREKLKNNRYKLYGQRHFIHFKASEITNISPDGLRESFIEQFSYQSENALVVKIRQAVDNPIDEKNLLIEIKKEWLQMTMDEKEAFIKLKGNMLLYICVQQEWWTIYSYLKNEGFEDTPDNKGLYPAHHAVLANKTEFFEKMLKKTPSLTTITITLNEARFQCNELCFAIATNNTSMVKIIFSTLKKENISCIINEWGTLIHIAIAAPIEKEKILENLRLIEFLLDQEYCDIKGLEHLFSVKDRNGRTIFAAAAEQGKLSIVDYLYGLVSSNVNIAKGTEKLQDAFWRAAINKQAEVVKYFMSRELVPDYAHPLYRVWNKQENKSTLIENIIEHHTTQYYLHGKMPPDAKIVSYENIVFQGGGMKGAIYPYAYEAFISCCETRAQEYKDENGDEIKANTLKAAHLKRVFGTSAGSSFALGVALNFDVKTLKDEMNKDFSELLSDNTLISIANSDNALLEKAKLTLSHFNKDASKALETLKSLYDQYQNSNNLIDKGKLIFNAASNYNEIKTGLTKLTQQIKEINTSFEGYDSGEKIYIWLQELLENNGFSKDITFGELSKLVKKNKAKHLYVAVTNLRTGRTMVLNSEDSHYSDYCILDAVRASMSIPFVFKPHRLRIKAPDGSFAELPDDYVDGGVLYNYGIDYFDRKLYTDNSSPGDNMFPEFNPNVIGFRFKPHFHELQKEADLKDYIIHFLTIYGHAENLINLFKNTEYHRSIELDTWSVETLTFRKLSDEEIKMLERNATETVGRHFKYYEKNSKNDDVPPSKLPSQNSKTPEPEPESENTKRNWMLYGIVFFAVASAAEIYRRNRNKNDFESFTKPDNYIELSTYPLLIKNFENLKPDENGKKVIAITGMSGIGKSELARYVAQNLSNQKKFSGGTPIIYELHVENKENILEELKKFCSFLKIDTDSLSKKCEENRDLFPQLLIQEINHKIAEHPDSLLIFDNAKDYNAIKKYVSALKGNSLKILITSKKSNFFIGDSLSQKEFNLNKIRLTQDDSEKILLLRTSLAIDDHAKKLIAELDSLPLALSLAGYYIKEKGINYEDYYRKLTKYQDALEYELGDIAEKLDNYNKTQTAAVRMNIDEVIGQEDQKELLYFCSFLNPDNISFDILRRSLKEKHNATDEKVEIIFKTALTQFEKYSLITVDEKNECIHLHRTVQYVSKKAIGDQEELQDIISSVLSNILSDLKKNIGFNAEEYPKTINIMNHIEYFLGNFENFDEIKVSMLFEIGNAYGALGDAQKSKELLERALIIDEKHYGKDHPSTVSI